MRWCTWAQPGRRLTPLKTRRGTNTLPFVESVKAEHWILLKGAGNIARRERKWERERAQSLPQLSLRKRKVMSKTRDILFPKTLKRDTEAAAELPLDYPRPLPRTGVVERCWHQRAPWRHGVWVLSGLQRKHSLLSVSMVRVIRKTFKRVRAVCWHRRGGGGALSSLAGAQARQWGRELELSGLAEH